MLWLMRWFGVTRTDAERLLDTEAAYAEEIERYVLRLQADTAVRQHRLPCRGTHANGVCVCAEFHVPDLKGGHEPAIGTRLARGVFATPGVYAATVRFANSDPNLNPDSKPDIRSLSFSVDLTSGGTDRPPSAVACQDFSMQSAPTLPLNDARVFLATMKVITASKPLKALLSLPLGDQLRVMRALGLAQVQARQPLKPYQQLRYWSTVPFRHGPADVVKQCATPRTDNPAHALRRGEPDCLQRELLRHLDEDRSMSRFDIGLQFMDTGRMTYHGMRHDAGFWIENASVAWKEAEAPFHVVAQLRLLPRSQLSPEAREATYFDVTRNALAESEPVGSINRMRWRSEAASRQARTGTGVAPAEQACGRP